MTILYFTATGNGLYLAKKIGGKLISIPKAIKDENLNFADDKIGIIFPVYGWAVPQYIRDFLSKVKIDSKYIFAVLSYGKFHGAATTHLLKIASESGINFSYVNVIKMVDNYLPVFEMGNQIKHEPKKQIDFHLNKIIDDITAEKQKLFKDSFFNKIMTKILLISDQYKTGIGITQKYNIEDTCTKCGVCRKVCPTDNIQMETSKLVFGKQCLTCLSCTHNCPQNAIRLSNEKSKLRFRNEHIELKEIIDSNN